MRIDLLGEQPVNLAIPERVVSILLGAGLTRWGRNVLRRGRFWGLFLLALGSAVSARGASGRCAVKRALKRRAAARGGLHVTRGVSVLVPREQVYRFWRRLENLPRFMEHVKEVTTIDYKTSHWRIELAGRRLEWDAEIVEDVAGRHISWRSLPGGDVDHRGFVEMRDAFGGRGTEIDVSFEVRPPAGDVIVPMMGRLVELWTEGTLAIELIRMRQLLETGEIATGARRRERQPEKQRELVAQPPLIATTQEKA